MDKGRWIYNCRSRGSQNLHDEKQKNVAHYLRLILYFWIWQF